MPSFSLRKNYALLRKRREEYRAQLLAKGVVDGSNKMLRLMCKRFGK